MPDTAAAAKAISRAVEQTKLAYRFGANSYSHSAMSFCMAAEIALHSTPPDWISEFIEHAECRTCR